MLPGGLFNRERAYLGRLALFVSQPMKTVVAMALAAAIVFVACGEAEEELATDPTATPRNAITKTSPSLPTAVSPPVSGAPKNTLTYADPAYGYSFEYPATWYLSPPKDNGGQLILYSYDVASIPPVEAGMPVPKDKLKVFFWVAEGVDKPIDQWLAEGRARASVEQNLPPPTVISQSPATLADQQGLIETTESDGMTTTSYYIAIGEDRLFVVNAGPADSRLWGEFEKVLATLRFSQ